MRKLCTFSVAILLSGQLPPVTADRQADFREAYQGYEQAISTGDIPAALKTGERAYKLGSKLYGKDNINTAKLAINYATLLNDGEEFKKARKVLKGKLAVMEAKYDAYAMDLIAPLFELARAEFNAKKPDASLAYFSRASSIVSKQDNPIFRAMKNAEIADILQERGGHAHSRPYSEAAYHDYANTLEAQDTRLGMASYHMGLWSLKDRDLETAVDYLNGALTAFDQEGPMNAVERSTRHFLVNALSRLGRTHEATPHCVALGEDQDASRSPTALFAPPLGIARGQLREARGGVITLNFTVDARGMVANPRITNSTAVALHQTALEAISRFRYAPRFVNGEPVATNNVDYTFSFDVAGRM